MVLLRFLNLRYSSNFFQYATSEMARQAVELLNDSELDGRSIHVREDKVAVEISGLPASNSFPNKKSLVVQPKPSREDKIIEPTKVFVSNLPWATSEEVDYSLSL